MRTVQFSTRFPARYGTLSVTARLDEDDMAVLSTVIFTAEDGRSWTLDPAAMRPHVIRELILMAEEEFLLDRDSKRIEVSEEA